MTKLTLSVEEDVVARAKELAERNDTSVSAMFSRFVESMARAADRPGAVGPLTRRATGLVDLGGRDYKDLLSDALIERHGS